MHSTKKNMSLNWNFSIRLCLVLCLVISLCYGKQDTNSNKINTLKISSEETTTTKVNLTKPYQEKLICPAQQFRIPIFTPSCKTTKDCMFFGQNNLVCCKLRCIRGVVPPKPEPSHSPIFGLIDRVCPADPMPELLAVQECIVDEDCGSRICCPERPIQGVGAKNYCRRGAPRLDRMPVVKQLLLPLKNFSSYLQCSSPPPPFLDLFPKPCQSPFDCFPNLCCQENGKKICRPPKKSLFALIIATAQRIGTSSLIKNFIERIS